MNLKGIFYSDVYLNVFSCKDFDEKVVVSFAQEWFEGNVVGVTLVKRI